MLTAIAFALSTLAYTIPGLQACQVVAVQMLDDVDSSDANPGDFFRFQTINAVTVGDKVVIPARTMGYGIVVIAEAASSGSRPGTLVLEPRYLVLPNGEHLGVVLNHNTSELQTSGQSGSAPGYLGSIPFVGAAAGIFNFFHHGRNVEVKKGTEFTVFPSELPETEKCQQNPQL
jgi:hypothetical protein